MDYMGLCEIIRHNDFETFLEKYRESRIVLMTTKAKKIYHKFKFKKMICFYLEEKVQECQENYIKN